MTNNLRPLCPQLKYEDKQSSLKKAKPEELSLIVIGIPQAHAFRRE